MYAYLGPEAAKEQRSFDKLRSELTQLSGASLLAYARTPTPLYNAVPGATSRTPRQVFGDRSTSRLLDYSGVTTRQSDSVPTVIQVSPALARRTMGKDASAPGYSCSSCYH